MFKWQNKEFWVDQTKAKRQKILDEWKQGQELDYDDDTEICGYHKNREKYEVWLAVYDGGLEWTLNEYSEDGNEWENVCSSDWNVKDISTLRECDLEIYARLQYHKLLKEYKDQQKGEI